MQEEFLAFVAEERDRGRTVFLSSHELDEVQRACDRVGIIRDGPARRGRERGRDHRPLLPARDDRVRRPVDPAEFRRIPGVSELERDGSAPHFKAHGDLDPVIKAAARHTVTDVELIRPTLEEIFLTYYGNGGG